MRWTCAESKAGGFCTASEAARPNSGLGGPLVGGVMSLRLNFGPSRLENAPEAGRKGARARDLRQIQVRQVLHYVRGGPGSFGAGRPLGRQSYIVQA